MAAKPLDKPKPTTPPPAGQKWVPTYGWWRPAPAAAYQRYTQGWHLGAAFTGQSHADPANTGTPGSGIGAGGSGAATTSAPPVDVTPTPAPAPVYDQTKDSWYMGQRGRMERETGDKVAGVSGKIEALTFKGADGLDEYGRKRADLDRTFRLSARNMVDQMSKAGLLRSGRRNRETGEMAREAFTKDMELQDTVGARGIERLQTERTGYQQQLVDMLASLAREAEGRFTEGGGTYGYGG